MVRVDPHPHRLPPHRLTTYFMASSIIPGKSVIWNRLLVFSDRIPGLEHGTLRGLRSRQRCPRGSRWTRYSVDQQAGSIRLIYKKHVYIKWNLEYYQQAVRIQFKAKRIDQKAKKGYRS